jgi:hypothetical protein
MPSRKKSTAADREESALRARDHERIEALVKGAEFLLEHYGPMRPAVALLEMADELPATSAQAERLDLLAGRLGAEVDRRIARLTPDERELPPPGARVLVFRGEAVRHA